MTEEQRGEPGAGCPPCCGHGRREPLAVAGASSGPSPQATGQIPPPPGCAPPARRGERAVPFEGGGGGGRGGDLPSRFPRRCVRPPTHARVGAGAPAPPSEPSVERSRCARPCVHIALCVARGLYSRYWEPEAGGLRGKGPRKMQTNAMHLYTITGYNR